MSHDTQRPTCGPDAPLVVVVVVLDVRRRQLLVVQRKEDPSLWGLPGGKVEPGEAGLAAACRELREETGLVTQPRPICWQGNLQDGKLIGVWSLPVGEILGPSPKLLPQSGEPPARWVPWDFFAGGQDKFSRFALRALELVLQPRWVRTAP